jgi:hypothetical protein
MKTVKFKSPEPVRNLDKDIIWILTHYAQSLQMEYGARLAANMNVVDAGKFNQCNEILGILQSLKDPSGAPPIMKIAA